MSTVYEAETGGIIEQCLRVIYFISVVVYGVVDKWTIIVWCQCKLWDIFDGIWAL